MVGEKTLAVLIGGDVAGALHQNAHGRLSFVYEADYAGRPDATPLSLSMPLVSLEHSHRRVDPFVRGLLPDNDAVLRRWGVQFGVSPNSPFALLRHVGEDVAGAVQFVSPARVDSVVNQGRIDWVTDDYVAERLRVLRADRAAWDDVRAPGRFSLAGAQSKFALCRAVDGRWGVPSGRSATTHILKPSLPDLADQEVNEHLCLRAAARLGMRTASSEVATIGDEQAILLSRYDRAPTADGEAIRVHQEDSCQALSVYPDRKYQRQDGGPGPLQIVEVLRTHLAADQAKRAVEIFCRALAFNWVVYGPDAHAKNYSLLLSGPDVRLAPLYDISSVAPYPEGFDLSRMAMAMSIGGTYENRLVTGERWRELARQLRVDPDVMLGWVDDVVAGTPAAFAAVVDAEPVWIGELAMTHRLLTALEQHSASLLTQL